MGTSYMLFQDGKYELTVNEMSNRFDLVVSENKEISRLTVEVGQDLTPTDLVNLALKLVEVASYWVEDEYYMASQVAEAIRRLSFQPNSVQLEKEDKC